MSAYFLVYGSEAILPVDIAFRAPRVEHYNEEQAAVVRTEDVDRAEKRLITCIRTAKYLEGLWRYYNRNIKGRSFVVGDLVLRRKQKTEGMHKLFSPWEGPYVVKEVTRPGSYRLCDMEGIDIPNSWHTEHLIHFYPWNALDMYSSLHNEWSFCRHNLSLLFLHSSLMSIYDYQLQATP